MGQTPPQTVKKTGAEAGDVLIGISKHNDGLLIKVTETQRPGIGGRVVGPILVLHEGIGTYAAGIRTVIARRSAFSDAAEFILAVSAQPGCVNCTHILNANSLWRRDVGAIRERILTGESLSVETVSFKSCRSCGRLYDDTINFCLEDGTFLSSDEPVKDEIETVVRRAKIRSPRANSRSFIQTNFPNLRNCVIRTSRRFERSEKPQYMDNWWVSFNQTDLLENEFVILAGALDRANTDYKVFKIPSSYLLSNLDKVDVGENGMINLYVHFHDFVDIRHNAHLPFGQFAVN